MKAVRIHEVGGPEVLKYEDCPDLKPGPGEAVVNVEAVGVNFTDVGTRRGSAPPASFPWIPGREAAGTVSAIGEGVTEAKVGDAVGYCSVGSSYAEQVLVPSSALIKLPEGIDAKMAAAVLLQGMTAHYLAFSTYSLQPGDSCVVHAGAGGTGLMLIQMAKRAGARVFATVSTEEKAALAKEAGADRAIIYTREEFDDEVMKATDGQGVQVVYDSVGKTTFDKSLNCLGLRGCLALYGAASGPVTSFEPARLARGSLSLIRPSLGDYTSTRKELLQRAGEVLGWVSTGELKVRIGGTFALSEAAEAHRQLEGRETTGKLLLVT